MKNKPGRPKGRKDGQVIATVCKQCGVSKPTSSSSRKYCSRRCFEISQRTYTVCPKCDKSFWNKKKTTYCSRSCSSQSTPRKRGYHLSEEHRRKIGEARSGSKSNFWRGGVTPWQKKERRSIDYVNWRKSVFERDNYTCLFCGIRGGTLNADHIKPWIAYPDLRLDIANGRTLCVPCHKQTPTYAKNYRYLVSLEE